MNHKKFSLFAIAPLLLALSACDKTTSYSDNPNNSLSSQASLITDTNMIKDESLETDIVATTSTSDVTDKWIGQWNGPEGTFLRIDGNADNYTLTIQNLDGPLIFTGIGIGEEIQFERNGIKETIHASNGEQTGMKWLNNKSDCLTIRVGEGYCK